MKRCLFRNGRKVSKVMDGSIVEYFVVDKVGG